jgi:hypothetical protein
VWLRAADFRRSLGGERGGGRFSNTEERGSGVRGKSGGWETAEPPYQRGQHGWGSSNEHDVGGNDSASTNHGERKGVGANILMAPRVVLPKTTSLPEKGHGDPSVSDPQVDSRVSPVFSEKTAKFAPTGFVEKVGQLGVSCLKASIVASRGEGELAQEMIHKTFGVGAVLRGFEVIDDVGKADQVGELVGHVAVPYHVVSHELNVRGDVRLVQGVLGNMWPAGTMEGNVGQGKECTHVASPVCAEIGVSEEGLGTVMVQLNKEVDNMGARVALVHAGAEEIKVEQQGPRGRKSMRQWKRRARALKVVHGKNCKS